MGDIHQVAHVEWRDLVSERALHSATMPFDGSLGAGEGLYIGGSSYGRIHPVWHEDAVSLNEWRLEFDLDITGEPQAEPGKRL